MMWSPIWDYVLALVRGGRAANPYKSLTSNPLADAGQDR